MGSIYTYTGTERIPWNARSIRVAASVTTIPKGAFSGYDNLVIVELAEGLKEIGDQAFESCRYLYLINFPSTLERIGARAFHSCSSLERLDLPDSVNHIGAGAFGYCASLRCAKIPAQVSHIQSGTFQSLDYMSGSSMVSVELNPFPQVIDYLGLSIDHLRNVAVAIPSMSGFESIVTDTFDQTDISRIIRDSGERIHALKHRFDNLPLHELAYYQGHFPTKCVYNWIKRCIKDVGSTVPSWLTCERMESIFNEPAAMWESKIGRNPTGTQQDCLCMTPLHTLACSSQPVRDFFELIIEYYPENLIAKDKWGATPLLYALWTDSPSVELLIESQEKCFPNESINWGHIMKELSDKAPPGALGSAIETYEGLSNDKQQVDWESLLHEMADCVGWGPDMNFRTLVSYAISNRLDQICVDEWKADIRSIVRSMCCEETSRNFQGKIKSIYSKLSTYENIIHGAPMLEMALWKATMNTTEKDPKMLDVDFRNTCRMNCGLNTVFTNVLPFLLPEEDEASEDDSFDEW